MKNLIFILSFVFSAQAFATQSTIVTGHGADGCVMVKVDNISTNPTEYRNKCFCKDSAIDGITYTNDVSCGLYCIGSANQAGKALTCTASTSPYGSNSTKNYSSNSTRRRQTGTNSATKRKSQTNSTTNSDNAIADLVENQSCPLPNECNELPASNDCYNKITNQIVALGTKIGKDLHPDSACPATLDVKGTDLDIISKNKNICLANLLNANCTAKIATTPATPTNNGSTSGGDLHSEDEAKSYCKGNPDKSSTIYWVEGPRQEGTITSKTWNPVTYQCPKAPVVAAGVYSRETLKSQCSDGLHDKDPTCISLSASGGNASAANACMLPDGSFGSLVGGQCTANKPSSTEVSAADLADQKKAAELSAQIAKQGGKVTTTPDNQSGIVVTTDGKSVVNKELIYANEDQTITANNYAQQTKDDVSALTKAQAGKTADGQAIAAVRDVNGNIVTDQDGTATAMSIQSANVNLQSAQDAYTNSKKMSQANYDKLVASGNAATKDNDGNTRTLADYRENLKDNANQAKADQKSVESAVNTANKKALANGDHNSMQNAGDAESKGSTAYGGADVEKTKLYNGLVTMGDTAANIGGSMAVNNAGAKATSAVTAKGATATQADLAQATVDTAKATYNAELRATMVDSIGAIAQGMRLGAHASSIKDINKNYTTETSNVRALRTASHDVIALGSSDAKNVVGGTQNIATTDIISEDNRAAYVDAYNQAKIGLRMDEKCAGADPAACNRVKVDVENQARSALTKQISKNVEANHSSAIKTQNDAVASQITALAGTLTKVQQHVAGMANAKAAQTLANAGTGGGFSFNPGGGNSYGDEGTATDPTAVAGAIVDSNAADDALKNTDQLNPGVDGGVNPTAPGGAFASASNPPPGPGAGGGGGLSTGGTSAAKDDAAKGGEAPGKTAAGTYSAGDNTAAGSYSRNGGGGSGAIGMDNSFADLLKKFLPGGDEEKKADGNLAFDQDRNPASDSAAVLGRNKNIFDEIHKRYEKKSTEGAIVF